MIIDTTQTEIECKIKTRLLQEGCFRTCKLVMDIQGHLDRSSVRQSFFSEHLNYYANIKYEKNLVSASAYYCKDEVIRVFDGNTISPQRYENSVIYSFRGAASSLIASQIAQKLAEQEWNVMCQLLIACVSKEVVGHSFGSVDFCQRSFKKFADKNVHTEYQPLINPKDAHKCLGLDYYIECKSVPLDSMFLLPPFDELGAIATTLGVTATQSGEFSGVFWTEAAYCIVHGEQAGWYSC